MKTKYGNLSIVAKRQSGKGLYYLKLDGEIIKRSFRKKRLLALKKKLEERVIDIEDIKYQTILESDITRWEKEI
jgi:hypothetical protein